MQDDHNMKFKLLSASLISLLCINSAMATQATQITDKKVSSSYAKTKYPIVFNHGMGGFISIGNDTLGMDYFYQILPDFLLYAYRLAAFKAPSFASDPLFVKNTRSIPEIRFSFCAASPQLV